MPILTIKTIIKRLPLKTYVGVVIATACVYLLLDLFPILQLFPNIEARIVQILWQSFVWACYSVFIAFFICYGLSEGFTLLPQTDSKNLGFFNFFCRYFSEFLATKLRAIIKTTLWGLLFIIPGFVMALRYSLSELVIFFNPNFLEDRAQDPLAISAETLGFQIPKLLILASLYLILPSILDSVFDHAHLLYEPYPRLAQIALYSVLNIFTYIYLFKIFYRSVPTLAEVIPIPEINSPRHKPEDVL